jgi:hypothetical protein
MPGILDTEIKYFYKVKDELCAKNPDGGFAVIKEDTLLGVWLNRNDAIKEGIEAYGNVSFLVKNITDDHTQLINYSRPLNFSHALSYDL